ncbi:ketopantoate reductase family protein [Halomonas sp. Y3]|uniref:ketopantoate reductase family protein n=1 Tax=Halomonas sp. Y3 TaxID=2956797 RepID=UPI00209CCC4F|nr:2-dehydropantoate 2-reductase [Halomonas sp. Y3]
MTPLPHHWIIGPGALGRLIGLRLATSGSRVTLAGRRPLPERQTLITPEGTRLDATLFTTTLANLAGTPDVVHLTTKAYGAEGAHAALAPRLPAGTPLVLWQNGFGCQPRLTARHDGPVLCATTTEGAFVEGDDRVVHAGHGETLIGDLSPSSNAAHGELARTLASALTQAGLPARTVDDIRRRLWQKLAVNAAINPLVARFRILNGELRAPRYRPLVESLIAEVAAILAAEGIDPPEGQGAPGWQALVWRVIEGTAGNRASMLQDVLAARPTEHEAILGPLLDAADAHGLQAPGLAELAAWLRQRELAGIGNCC